jgi:hypothetical protein
MAGFYEGTDLADKSFYGFRLNPDNGQLTVEVVNDGTSAVVLPQDSILDKYDYKQWLWSQNALNFQWDKGHLQVKMI